VNLTDAKGNRSGMGTVLFVRANADQNTIWPEWLDPVAAGVIFEDWAFW
jgi:hypothetical protein